MRVLALFLLALSLPVLSAEVTDADVEKALKTWRRYEMPEPPKDARLVLLESGATHYEEGVPQPKRFRLVYKLPVAPGSTERSYFMGTSADTSAHHLPEVDKGKIEDLSGDVVEYGSYHPQGEFFPTSNSFAMALHVWAQGHKRLGREIAGQSLRGSFGAMFCPFVVRESKSVAELLPQVMWAHWLNQLIRPDTDRKILFERMSKAHAEFEVLRSRVYRDEHPHRDLLSSLEAALKPVSVEPGTVEADIEALVEACPQFNKDGSLTAWGDVPQPHLPILKRGFDAVPALIRYAGDIRLTRVGSQAFMKVPPKIHLVGDLVRDLLYAIGGPELEWDWLVPNAERAVDTKKLQEWWTKAREEGEEKYLRRNLMKEQRYLNNDTLTLVAAKYPKIIIEKYTQQVKEGADIAQAIAAIEGSNLPLDAKLAVFREGATAKDLRGREAALRALRPLDEKTFLEELIKTLDGFGESTDVETLFMAPETRYPYLLLLTDDQKAWDALARAAKRAEVGLRMEYLRQLAHGGGKDITRKQRLGLLASFMDDTTAHDDKRTETGVPRSFHEWKEFTVRDLVAATAAHSLGIKERPEKDADAKQWTAFRAKVRAAFKEEGIEPAGKE